MNLDDMPTTGDLVQLAQWYEDKLKASSDQYEREWEALARRLIDENDARVRSIQDAYDNEVQRRLQAEIERQQEEIDRLLRGE